MGNGTSTADKASTLAALMELSGVWREMVLLQRETLAELRKLRELAESDYDDEPSSTTTAQAPSSPTSSPAAPQPMSAAESAIARAVGMDPAAVAANGGMDAMLGSLINAAAAAKPQPPPPTPHT